MLLNNLDALAMSSAIQAIANMKNDQMQNAICEQLIEELRFGTRIALIGTGKTFSLLNRTESTARSLGLDCTAYCSNTLAHGDFGGLINSEIQIFISKSGTTKEIVNSAEYCITQLGMNPKNMVALTCQPLHSGLNTICGNTLVLEGITELITEGGCDIAPTISSLAFSLTLDLLLTKASKLNNEQFRKLHPGGAIGISK